MSWQVMPRARRRGRLPPQQLSTAEQLHAVMMVMAMPCYVELVVAVPASSCSHCTQAAVQQEQQQQPRVVGASHARLLPSGIGRFEGVQMLAQCRM